MGVRSREAVTRSAEGGILSSLPHGFVGAVLLGLVVAGAIGMAGAMAGAVLAAGLWALVSGFLTRQVQRHYPHRAFGACNVATLLRAAIVAGLAGLAVVAPGGWLVLGVAAVGLALDGVDGALARRSGLSSGFGARFDMETDAALALVLAAHVWLGGMTGAEVLILGVTRYVFVAAFVVAPWLAAPLPERFGRKVVCVVQIGALILLQAPGLPGGVATGLAWGAVAALLWSFGRDVAWLWRHRG